MLTCFLHFGDKPRDALSIAVATDFPANCRYFNRRRHTESGNRAIREGLARPAMIPHAHGGHCAMTGQAIGMGGCVPPP